MISHQELVKHQELVFEQYYQHLQHIENMRHNFTNMFVVFTSALLAFFSQIKPERSFLIGMSVAMLVISILGLFLSLTLGDAVSAYSEAIREIIDEWKVCDYEKKLRLKKLTMSNTYKSFYVLASVGWLILLSFYAFFS